MNTPYNLSKDYCKLKLTHAPNKDQPEYFTTYTALYEGENFYFVRFYWNVKPNVYGTTYQKCDAFNNELKKFNVGKNEIDGMIKIQLMDFSGNILNEREINAN